MIRRLTMLLLLLFTINSYTQEDAWVYLTDKPNEASALSNPISILTQKALDRKQNHGIAIDARDVPVHEPYIADLKTQTGITVMAKSKWFNAVHVRGTEADISALSTLSFVDSIDFADNNLDNSSRLHQTSSIRDVEDESIVFTYGNSQNQVEMINADDLHLDDFTGEGITIAVMDSGFPNVNTMGAFQRLRDNGDLLDGYDFVTRNTNVYANTSSSHGTRVLSTMAAFAQDQYVGTAPDASYYLFITEDAGSETPVEESYWVEAAERADSLGVDMINTSLGYRVFDNSNYDYTPADMNGQTAFITKGASIAVEKGILVVVSAGNSGASAWQTVGAPADSPNVLSIGAVDENGNYVSFSSQGGAAQLGYQKPDVVARGGAAFVIDQNNNITQNNGTSFSGPIMCGGIAALWQAIPDASPTEIKNLVRQSASQYTTPDDFLGYGIPDLALARTLGVEQKLIDSFKFYPNPVKDVLHFNFPVEISNYEISIYNQLGQQVAHRIMSSNTNRLNVVDLSGGIYLMKISSEQYIRTLKFMKQ
ncbi:S8 family serine peptidase [uncultured Winogradskyella sp.]|uniref:S8 family serine peptidase n=1 Tax=uncultured Winogradskyella sp. TaxID=395353 RepID=UPI002617B9B7|nr:S8 family serine peptidase [uncultured Winogradskyella sp.]